MNSNIESTDAIADVIRQPIVAEEMALPAAGTCDLDVPTEELQNAPPNPTTLIGENPATATICATKVDMETANEFALHSLDVRRGHRKHIRYLHLEPHPSDDEDVPDWSIEKMFEFVMARRAEVAAARALFGLRETWTGQMEYIDPLDLEYKVSATVTVSDLGVHATARIDAIECDGSEPERHWETLVIVPHRRLSGAKSAWISSGLRAIAQPARHYLLEQIKVASKRFPPYDLAFAIPVPGGDVTGYVRPVWWFRAMLFRAMFQWVAERDLAGGGPNGGPNPALSAA